MSKISVGEGVSAIGRIERAIAEIEAASEITGCGLSEAALLYVYSGFECVRAVGVGNVVGRRNIHVEAAQRLTAIVAERGGAEAGGNSSDSGFRNEVQRIPTVVVLAETRQAAILSVQRAVAIRRQGRRLFPIVHRADHKFIY